MSPRVASVRNREHREVGSGERARQRGRCAAPDGPAHARAARLTPIHDHASARAARRWLRPMSPSPTTQRVVPRSRVMITSPTALPLLRREALHLLSGPEGPPQAVFGHPGPEDPGGAGEDHLRGQLGHEKALHARAHVLDPAEPRRAAEQLAGKFQA